MPLQATAGAASYDGFGGGAAAPTYIEDVFSTYLYTGDGSTQTITNGIDLSTKGGLVWMKGRSGATDHALYDTARGTTKDLVSNDAGNQTTQSTGLTAFGTTGFTIGALAKLNTSSATYVSWTFREQSKFFDVVTYTGNGSNRTIAHSLGSVPGCIIVKRTDDAANWQVYHRSLANTEYMVLNNTAAKATGTTRWNSTTPTSTVFSIGTDTTVNASGGTYVAYLFAHDAGGFGASGTDNVISCGLLTTPGSGDVTVNLGYEPQFLLYKDATSGAGNWELTDILRSWSYGTNAKLQATGAGAENTSVSPGNFTPTATGFRTGTNLFGGSRDYVYIAIRRGPMRTPTTGTSVYTPSTVGATNNITVGFPADTYWAGQSGSDWRCFDRLRSGLQLATNTTAAEGTFDYYPTYIHWDSNSVWNQNLQNAPVTNYFFRRAPGFFDVVCYTSDNTYAVINHNLGVVPQLVIQKRRNGTSNWFVTTGAQVGYLELTDAFSSLPRTFTSTTFEPATTGPSYTYVAYLFATVAGVSKVGSYTGTAALLTVNCGFTAGARFVLIKRTDSTGDWYVWNSADGIVSGDDPYRILNGTTLTSGTNYVDTDTTGFKVTAAAPAGLNANGGTYIFLAIA